ncbi:Vacuolar basic amino acid transporter 5 [Phlyctema vagabunda]|uniref:Vacuolar basic amino acid transporter 5 n=1 Tax=Phlyctema vagabunda TaxID=108571 RepID=A0ABR4PU97_9HELO
MADASEKITSDSSGTSHREGPMFHDIPNDDPHIAAFENNNQAANVSRSTLFSVFFLGLAFTAPVSCGFILVSGIQTQIGTRLGDMTNLVWIAGSWSVASSVSFSMAGSLSDIFGRRWVVLSGNLITIIGAIIGATADTVKIIVAGSTFIGFGAGIIFVAYAGIPEMLPNKYRGIGLGWTELCITIPWSTFSVLIGNQLVEKATWKWCYYIALMYAVISTIGIYAFYYPPSRPRNDYSKTRWQEFKELDFIGNFLYATGLPVMLIGFTWAGTSDHPWDSVSVIAPIIIGVALFGACFAYDFTIAKNPLFPLPLFAKVREFTILLVVVFVSGMIFTGMTALLPQATLWIFTNDSTEIGLIALPNGFGSLIGGWLIPSLMHKIKHLRWQVITALVVQTLANALYVTVIPDSKAGWMILQFFGQGCFTYLTTLCYVISSLHVPHKDLGLASGLIGTFRSGGGSIGNAILSTILTGIINRRLGRQIVAAALGLGFNSEGLEALVPAVIQNALGVPGAFDAVPGITPAVEEATAHALKEAYAYAFKRVFYATIPFGVIATICAWFIKDPSQYLTNHVSVHMEKEVLGGVKEEHVENATSEEAIHK